MTEIDTEDRIVLAGRRAEEKLAEYDNPSGLLRQMVITNEVMKTMNHRENGFKYPSFYDFVLELGTEKRLDVLDYPDDIGPGTPKQCYINAAMLAFGDESLTYVEGYAATDDLGIAMSHAWVEDADGNIIDNTWGALERKGGATYYGVKFATDYVAKRWERHPTHFGGVLGEDYGHYVHVEYGVFVDDNGVVTGEVGTSE